jgi:hypothetical protein
MTKLQAGRPLIPGSILSRMKKLFSQNLQTNYGAQPAFYPVGNWLLPGTNSRSVESTSYCNVMPRLRTSGGVPTWCRAELSTEGTLPSLIGGKLWMESAKGRNKLRNSKYKMPSGTAGVSHILAWCWSGRPLLGRPRLFCQLQYIPTLTWQCVSRLFSIRKYCVYLSL